MSQIMTPGDLAVEVMTRGSLSFYDYEPRGQEGHVSNIAAVLGRNPSETHRLLQCVDELSRDPHYDVDLLPVEQPSQGSKGESFPKKFRVIIQPA